MTEWISLLGDLDKFLFRLVRPKRSNREESLEILIIIINMQIFDTYF